MSLFEKTGGPAFPCEIGGSDPDANEHQTGSHTAQQYGISVRDYFAAEELSKVDGCGICDAPAAYARLADHCYRMADAMLEARKAPATQDALVKLVKDAQAILADHLPPGSPSERVTLSKLLELLDGPQARAALGKAGAA